MLRRLLGLVLLVVVCIACSASENEGTSTADAARETTVKLVDPINSRGVLRAPYSVTAVQRTGNCHPTSEIVSGGYRCVSDRFIFDPCWAERGRRSLVCVVDPWTSQVTRFIVDRPVEKTSDSVSAKAAVAHPYPWAVQLTHGQRCLLAIGAHDSIDPDSGLERNVVDYFCGRKLGLVLLRGVNTRRPLWSARSAVYAEGRYERTGERQIAVAVTPTTHP